MFVHTWYIQCPDGSKSSLHHWSWATFWGDEKESEVGDGWLWYECREFAFLSWCSFLGFCFSLLIADATEKKHASKLVYFASMISCQSDDCWYSAAVFVTFTQRLEYIDLYDGAGKQRRVLSGTAMATPILGARMSSPAASHGNCDVLKGDWKVWRSLVANVQQLQELWLVTCDMFLHPGQVMKKYLQQFWRNFAITVIQCNLSHPFRYWNVLCRLPCPVQTWALSSLRKLLGTLQRLTRSTCKIWIGRL